MTDKPEAVAGDITSHICYSRFSKKPSHRHHWKRDTLQPDCERCGTLIDREHNEVGPLQWGRAVQPAALPTRAQPDATALVEALRPFAKFVDKETCTITMIWEDGDYRSHYPNVLKPLDFFNAREALSAWEQSNADPEALRPQE